MGADAERVVTPLGLHSIHIWVTSPSVKMIFMDSQSLTQIEVEKQLRAFCDDISYEHQGLGMKMGLEQAKSFMRIAQSHF